MSQGGWHVRAARKTDRALLTQFTCADGTRPWEVEVEQFIQRSLFDWAFDAHAKKNDPRLLLLFDRQDGELIAVAAHERTELRHRKKIFAATRLEVVAVARAWQGQRLHGGARVSDVMMSAVMSDVSSRVPPRHARVFALIHEKNLRSAALCARHGLVEELSRVDPEYRRLVTAHQP